MTAHVVLLETWPPPDTVSLGFVIRLGYRLHVGYGTGEESFAVITFPLCFDVRAGGPNDETLHGHSLYRYGLKHYSVHRIEQSPWLQELERQNAVHPLHSKGSFMKDKVHYLFALKEETVECIVKETATTQAQIEVFPSQKEAFDRIWEHVDV